jgi:hypothetical protein
MGGIRMDKIVIKGRPGIKGIAEGEALVCEDSIQGWAGVDDSTGVIIERGHKEEGTTVDGKILVLPCSKGSNGWSCHFNSAQVNGHKPAGWIFSKLDSRAGVAAVVLDIPTVSDFDEDVDLFSIIESGDWIKVDGNTGDVEITKK